MKRLSNYVLFIGLIMAIVSMCIALAYRFTTLDLTVAEKLNLTTLYIIGAVLSILACGYKLFKEQK